MKSIWDVKNQGDSETIKRLSEELNIDVLLSNLLVQRELTTFDEAKDFFRPSLKSLHDPFLMKDMHKAVERITDALRSNEKVMVYGDYDVDGTTAVSLVFSFLKEFHDNVMYYIPDRYSEGYGISYQGIDYANANGYSLIIALDCGIKAVEKIDYANDFGIDFIICDHHRPGDTLPRAVAVLDPKRADCPYPYKGLSGCGVGFKFIQAFTAINSIPFSAIEKYLDLVVVSIASDIVPITGENRILAYYGLKKINTYPRPGIKAILDFCNIVKKTTYVKRGECIFTKEMTISDLVFQIGPRINAAGRMKNDDNSVALLTCKDSVKAGVLAARINEVNNDRRDEDSKTTEEALNHILQNPELKYKRVTILYKEDWVKGVVGIVASRLMDTYYRPTVILTMSEEGLITGSARSVRDFDVYEAIDHCSDLLEHFGGHKYAAGLALKPSNLEAFKVKLEAYVDDHITEAMLTPTISIDEILNLNSINEKFFRILRQFAPFGPENLAPIFKTNNLIDYGYGKQVGKEGKHLKLRLIDRSKEGYSFDAIGFNLGDHYKRISQGEVFSACYHIEENDWNGKRSIQLNIKDITFEE